MMKRIYLILVFCFAIGTMLDARTRDDKLIDEALENIKNYINEEITYQFSSIYIFQEIFKNKLVKNKEIKKLGKIIEEAHLNLQPETYELGITKLCEFEKEICKIFGYGSIAQIALLNEIAETYMEYSDDYQKSINIYSEIAEVAQISFDDALKRTAEMYKVNGKHRKAAEEYEKIAIIVSHKYGNNSDELIDILSIIGNTYLIYLDDYEKAFIAHEKIKEIVEKRFGKNSEKYKELLFSLASDYVWGVQDIHLSIKKLEELASILEEVDDIYNYSYLKYDTYFTLLSDIGNKYRILGDKYNSLNYFIDIAGIQLSLYGGDSYEYIHALKEVSHRLYEFKNYEECIMYYDKIAGIYKKNNRDEDYFMILRTIADVYSTKLNDYATAISKYHEIKEYVEDKYGENSKQHVKLLTDLKINYAKVKDTLTAQKISLKIDSILFYNLESIKLIDDNYFDYINQLEKFTDDFIIEINAAVLDKFNSILDNYKSIKDYNNEDYWEGLIKIGHIYNSSSSYLHKLGSYNDAIKVYAESAEIAFNNNNIEFCSKILEAAITNRGTTVSGYDLIEAYEKCAELSEKINNENMYSRFLYKIAETYKHLRKYDIAIDKYTEIVHVFDNTDANAVLNALENIAKIYEENLQDYEMAISAYKKFGEECIKNDKIHSNLDVMAKIAFIYSRKLKDYNKAINYYQEIANSSNENDHRCLEALSNIAYVLYLDSEVAIDYKIKESEKILGILDKYCWGFPIMNIKSSDQKEAKFDLYRTVLYVLTQSYYAKGEYQKVINYSKRLLEIPVFIGSVEYYPGHYGSVDKPIIQKKLFYDFLVRSLYNIGENNEAQRYYNILMEYVKKIVTNEFLELSESEREKFWNEIQPQAMHLAGSIALQSNDFQSIFVGDVFNANLFLKGILLNSSIEFNKIILESGNSVLVSLFNEYKDITQRNEESLYGQNEILLHESLLRQLALEHGNFMNFVKIQWQDIQAKLNNNEIVVDFINFPVNERETKYAALLLKKDWENPLFVPLFSEQELYDRVGKTTIYNDIHLGKMIWEPILKHIENDTTIYFSVSGLLHQIAIEYLPISNSTPLNEVYNAHRLSSMRQLMNRYKKQQYGNPAVLFGGIDYGPDGKDSSNNINRSLQVTDYEKKQITETLSSKRDFPPKFLSGSKIEVENIAQLLSNKNIKIQIFQGDTASKTLFQELSGKQLDIIHIATHGFYFSKDDTVKLIKKDEKQSSIEEKAMFRSGLLFAGANYTLLEKEVPERIDDGILTAKEVSLMDLRDVDLVVLSACQTGLGEISSEGIFGLQRGFKKAGVQTILMSLWKVDDKATQIMMTEFYKAYLETNNKRKSFLKAQQNLKDYMIEVVQDVPDKEKDRIFNPKTQSREYQTKRAVVKKYPYKDPMFWASFILLD